MGMSIPPIPPPNPDWSDEQKRKAIIEYRNQLAKQYAEYDNRVGFSFNVIVGLLAVAMGAIGIVMIFTGKL